MMEFTLQRADANVAGGGDVGKWGWGAQSSEPDSTLRIGGREVLSKFLSQGCYWNRVSRTPAPTRGLALLRPTEVYPVKPSCRLTR